MNRALLLMFVILMFLYTTGFQADRFVTSTTHNRLKFALNHGAHDAALQVVKSRLAEGQIVFERGLARKAFEAGLKANLQLNEDGTPYARTLLQAAPVIVFEDYVDDDMPEVTFPYNYVRTDQRISKTLKGPAVIFKVKVKLPRTNGFSYEGDVYKTVIYEYPLD
ncbi:hypothetical protein N0M98_15030 [Paenibacillus doosanensis]|uniref:Uncharacterized protein n=1 Tax=Paenibacillus konkukensis TaxID=2020716 RepID=A0ABY4RQ66_9BACL|nr:MULTISPECIES: hypothetical protein [Paenibacillus]MCS7461464.1 hypothetical protein [Paenibacillus doosanensis]UQZ83713.1 hypothetical protein SK3146_02920 [Paenibacillus konkukensis]